jgi:hypothetical protein
MKYMMIASLIMMSTSIMAQTSSQKSHREQAKKLYTSLTGTQPSAAELDYLEAKVAQGDLVEAGRDIVDQRGGVIKNNGAFYGVTIKDWATPKFNKQRTKLAPLNDGVATIIGRVRDEGAFNTILFDNVLYKVMGATFKSQVWYTETSTLPSVTGAPTACSSVPHVAGRTRILYRDPFTSALKCQYTKFKKAELDAAYTIDALYVADKDKIIETNLVASTNRHFESIEELGLDLGDPTLLYKTSQTAKLYPSTAPQAISGLLTTRAYGAAYFYAGTNRAPVAYAMEHFMCKDMEELNDTTIPDFRNRRDVDRSPGGTSELYKNRCVGCHAGMDALAGAFAYYDYRDNKVIYTPGEVVPKMNHNVVFPEGFVTSNDGWKNLWTQGHNSSLGWGSITEGEGVQSLGRLLAYTEAFHSCMAKQAYETVCMKRVATSLDKSRVQRLTASYKSSNYNLKRLFINASLECLED